MSDENLTAGTEGDAAAEPVPEGAPEVVEAPEPPVAQAAPVPPDVTVPPEAPAAAPPPPPEPPAQPYAPPVEVLPGPVSDSERVLAILGYIFGIVALVALFIEPYKDSPFVRLNAVQALGIWVLGLFYWIPVVGWILGVVAFVVAVLAVIKAFNGEYYRIPLLYDALKGFIER